MTVIKVNIWVNLDGGESVNYTALAMYTATRYLFPDLHIFFLNFSPRRYSVEIFW